MTDGTVHQVLVYDGEHRVGWCQFGSPPELPNIKNRGAYDRGADDPPDWRIGCIFTNAKDRGKGVAAAAVAAALDSGRMQPGQGMPRVKLRSSTGIDPALFISWLRQPATELTETTRQP